MTKLNGTAAAPRLIPLKVVTAYIIVSSLWIYFSDTILGAMIHDQQMMIRISVAKGFLFIIVTATLLYLHIRHYTSLLSASEARYRLLFDASPDLIILSAPDTQQYMECNEAFLKATGYSPVEIQGKTSRDLNLWADLQRRQEFYVLFAQTGKVRNFESQFRMKSGEIRTFLLSSEKIDLQGTGAILSILRDISDRTKAERALAASEQQFATAFHTNPDAIAITRLSDGVYLEVNEGFSRISGYGRDELLGRTSLELNIWVEPADRQRLVKELKARERVTNLEARFRCKDGRLITALMSAAMIEIDNTPCLLSITKDITELGLAKEEILHLNAELEQRVTERTAELARTVQQLQAEIEQRRQAQEEISWLNQNLLEQKNSLEEANRELESFSYSVSHDLRAPLRHIHGFLQIIMEDHTPQLDEIAAGYFKRIEKACLRMELLIESLLTLSRLTRQPLQTGKVDLSRLVTEAIAESQQTEPARQVHVTVQGQLIVTGDVALLRIAITNLVRNAWKFTSKTPAAAIEFGMDAEEGQQVYFLRDNGVGFDMAYMDKLFGVFQRLHNEKDFEGTGVGLATVQRIIQRHGGRIWAVSEPGKGCVFRFTLGTG
jgi:PAS domain S-box-containing protein